jgi:hypothetical protein
MRDVTDIKALNREARTFSDRASLRINGRGQQSGTAATKRRAWRVSAKSVGLRSAVQNRVIFVKVHENGDGAARSFGRANGALAKLQAGSHATATRRGSCRDKRPVGGSDLQLT